MAMNKDQEKIRSSYTYVQSCGTERDISMARTYVRPQDSTTSSCRSIEDGTCNLYGDSFFLTVLYLNSGSAFFLRDVFSFSGMKLCVLRGETSEMQMQAISASSSVFHDRVWPSRKACTSAVPRGTGSSNWPSN